MDKKNAVGLLVLVGVLAVVLTGMVSMQPQKPQVEPVVAEYNLSGFPVLPSEEN